MRILHIIEASFAGVGRHVLDLAHAQTTAGHDVHVIYSPVRESDSFAAERHDLHHATWHPVAMDRTLGPNDRAAFGRIRRIIASVDPHVVHGHSTKGGLMARLLAGRRPVVYTPNAVYSMNPTLGSRTRWVVRRIEALLARRTAAIIAVSPEERVHLEHDIGVPAATVRLIPNGIRPVERADAATVRAQLNLPADGPIVGFVGRLDAQKAPDDLLEIFARMAGVLPSATFVVVGDGPMGDELETRWTASGSPLAGRVQFAGTQPGTWAMSALDLLLLPSRYEGFPYVLIEAAHLGVPIVTTREACASLLAEGPARIAIGSAGDLDGLARLAIDTLRSGDGQNPAADQRFTVDVMGRAVEAVYREVAGRTTTTDSRSIVG